MKGQSTSAVIQNRSSIPADSKGKKAQIDCCIVGGGPGGMMLALLLARQGVAVTLLEMHKDFDGDFRGDTIHPFVLEILDQIGLSQALHQLRHTKIHAGPPLRSGNFSFSPIDFRRLKTKFPYVMLVPQTRFLEFVGAEARKYPNFRLWAQKSKS